jgi:lysophospholipase L1-like esterase
MAVMGDSLSAPYESYRALYGDRSWVQQLQAMRPNQVAIYNQAFSGATSNSLFQSEMDSDGVLHAPQVQAVADLVAHHTVKDVFLMIGANDVLADLPLFNPSNPSIFVSTFVTTVVGNIETALMTVAQSGHVNQVVSTVPDVTVTPYFQMNIAPLTPLVETAINLANDQIKTFAASQHIPVVDLYGLTRLATQTITVGGVQLLPATLANFATAPSQTLFTIDGFHPNSVGQGLIANTILKAFDAGYDVNIQHLRLTDQQILAEPGIAQVAGLHGHTFFDVTPFVLSTGNHDDDSGDFHAGAVSHDHSCSPASIDELFAGDDVWSHDLTDALHS